MVAVPTQEPVAVGQAAARVRPRWCAGSWCPASHGELRWRTTRQASIVRIVWPFGYLAEVDGERSALHSSAGTVVAFTGDRLELDGGEIGEGAWLACGEIRIIGEG